MKNLFKKLAYLYDQWKKKRLLKPFYVNYHHYKFAETPEEKAIVEKNKQLKKEMQLKTAELTEKKAGENSFRGIK
jgi:hypothetical protein